jgi:hypothetical protein
MYPKLYNSSGQLLAVLDNIIKETASIKRVVNGEFTFTFEAYEKELKSEYFDQTNNVVVDGQTFDIKYIEETHKREHKYSIQCEHVNYRLTDGNNNLYTTYANTGTPAQILADILSGTEFSVGVIEFTDAITISANAEITKKALIYQLAGVLGGELEYTNGGFTINILANIGKNNGFQARFGKNLDGITKIIDARGGLKTYYEVDIIELKNSNEYIEKDLSSLEVMDVGDTVQLIDKVIGLDVQNRIVSRQYNPIFAINTKVEIANTIELITDKINQIDTSSVKQNKLYNNVSISRDYGFRAERSDKLARATLGGGQISLDSGDGAGNYTPAVYFDVVTHKYKFIGDIVMEGGSISWDTVEKPNVSWDSVTDKPDIGDVALGRINSTYMDANGIWTPKVYATNISALLGKITVAQIEQLEVGTNVTMGPNASISWSQVSSRPNISF